MGKVHVCLDARGVDRKDPEVHFCSSFRSCPFSDLAFLPRIPSSILSQRDRREISHTSFSRPSGPLTIAPQRPCSWNNPGKYRAASKCQTLCQGLCTLKQPPGSPIALRGEEAAVLKIRSTSTRLVSCKSGSVSRALGQVPGPDWGTWLFSTNCDEVRQHGHKATKAQIK